MRTIELRVSITDAAVDEKVTTIFCTPVTRDPRCPDCGRQGHYRDAVTRPLTDLPVAGYPLVLRVAVPRYRCVTGDCGRVVFCQDLGKLAAPRSATTRRCARYVLRRLMNQYFPKGTDLSVHSATYFDRLLSHPPQVTVASEP